MEVEKTMEIEKSVDNIEVTWNLMMKNLNYDVLVEIFKYLDIFESNLALDRFCQAWERANNCQPLWEILDFSMLRSHFIKIHVVPFVFVHSQSESNLYNLLLIALNLSQGNIKTLIFHYNLFLTNEQFLCTAKRCPLVRRLVFVSWHLIKKIVIQKAIMGWKNLESMTMPSLNNPSYVFIEISRNCKNFGELKVMGYFHVNFASSLIIHLPNLKVLSIRCSGLEEEALLLILDGLKNLEVLNISHSCIVKLVKNRYDHYEYLFISHINPNTISEKTSRLREFLTCMKESCIMCERTRIDIGLPRWYRYEEGIWKDDEVSSLAF